MYKDDGNSLICRVSTRPTVDLWLPPLPSSAGPGRPHRGPDHPRMERNLRDKCVAYVEKLQLRFWQNKTETFLVSVTHLILRFTIVQNKFKQTNENKINHINDNHIKFEVALHFLGIWPTVHLSGGA